MMKKRIIVYVASLILICSAFFQPAPVSAADNVLVYDEPYLQYYDDLMQVLGEYSPVLAEPDENGYYFYNSTANDLVYCMSWGNMFSASDFDSYLPEVYDYYLLFTAYADVSVDDFSFCPDMARITFANCEPSSDVAFSVRYYHHDKAYTPYTGFTVTAKLPEYESTMPNYIYLYDSTLGTVPAAQLRVKVQIVQVDKSIASEIDVNSLLDELTSIDSKLDTVNDSLGTVNDSIQESINGYQGTGTQSAADNFTAGADELTSVEDELNTQANEYVSEFTAEGFDLNLLTAIGSSLSFVVTWFTNFWNMGGIFTAGLNFCFALSIVFFILRIRSL